MTVSSTSNRKDHVHNGTTTVWDYDFPIFAASDLVVTEVDANDVETTLVLNTDYTVQGVGQPSGGTITRTPAQTSGTDLIIRRVVPMTQATSVKNQGAFLPEVHEDQFDRLVMLAQQLREEMNRCIRFPVSGPINAAVLATALNRKGRYVAFDSSGNLQLKDVATGVTVSPLAESLLDDATIGAMWTTLGFPAFIQTLLDDTSAGAAQTTLGISTFIKTLLDDADAQTARTTLGALGLNLEERTATASGTDTYTATLSPAPASIGQGLYLIKFTNANTSATPTLNPNSLGAVTIKRSDGSSLAGGDIPAGGYCLLKHDGTNFLLLNHFKVNAANAAVGMISGQTDDTTPDRYADYLLSYDASANALKKVLMQRVSAIGSIIGYGYSSTTVSANTDGVTTIPLDNTIPQNTEGAEYTELATSYTPKESTSLLEIEVTIPVISTSVTTNFVGALFKDSDANAIQVHTVNTGVGGSRMFQLKAVVPASSTTARTYKFRYGPSGAATAYVNRQDSGDLFSTANIAYMTVKEIKQ